MTTHTAGSGRLPSMPFAREERRFDRQALLIALSAAIALHLGALLLPLPRAPKVQLPEAPPPRVIDLNQLLLEPPELPERTDRRPPATARRIPVPMVETLDLDPLAEPPRAAIEAISLDAAHDWAPLAPALPPPDSEPMIEGTPGLVPPTPLGRRAAPEYPELPRRIRAEGMVVLRAVITERGEVASIEVLRAPDPDLGFSKAAIEAVSDWRYRPGTYRGRPVPVAMTVYVEFDLH